MPNELIPGKNAVEEALRAGRRLLHIIVSRDSEIARSPLIREARRRGIQVRFSDRGALDSLVGRGRHQGIVAVAEARPPASLDDIFEEAKRREEQPFIAILDGVEDPQNLGAVIRSAESFGVHGIILPERRSAGVSPAVHKVSAGAVEYMRIVRVPNLPHALSLCRERGLWLVGAESRGQKSLFGEDLRGPVALVIGGEDTGLSRPVAERCDRIVRVPMSGRVRSLNLSATAAILFFEKRRQEANAGRPPSHHPFSGNVRLVARGQIDDWTSNCAAQAGVGSGPGSGVAIAFSAFGGGCPAESALIDAFTGVSLEHYEKTVCEYTGDWLWVEASTPYTAELTILGGTAALVVEGVGTASGTTYYQGPYTTLWVGNSGHGDWPECWGVIESFTIEPLD